MTKKILLALTILIVAGIAYLAIKNDKFNETTEPPTGSEIVSSIGSADTIPPLPYDLASEPLKKVSIEVKRSTDSTGRGSVQLIDSNKKARYCDLINSDNCNFDFENNARVKIVNIPSSESKKADWISGCYNLNKTVIDNDTCELIVDNFKKTIEIRFTKL